VTDALWFLAGVGSGVFALVLLQAYAADRANARVRKHYEVTERQQQRADEQMARQEMISANAERQSQWADEQMARQEMISANAERMLQREAELLDRVGALVHRIKQRLGST
jgi:DNA-binding PadR family transcriptional regulator